MDPAMITQLMQRYAQMQGQSAPFSQMGPGMQNMSPDQGMMQIGGPGAPNGIPMPKPMMNPGGNGMFPGGSGPFMPPGMEPGQGQMMQKPMMRDLRGQMPPQVRPDAPPPGPPRMRLPPGAGVWKNPATGQMMNQTPSFSGARNPADMKQDAPGPGSTPQTGGVMNAPPDDVSPIRMAMPANPVSNDRIRPKQQPGAPPFNQNAGGVSGQAPTEPGMVNKPWGNEAKKRQGLAAAMTSRVTKSALK